MQRGARIQRLISSGKMSECVGTEGSRGRWPWQMELKVQPCSHNSSPWRQGEPVSCAVGLGQASRHFPADCPGLTRQSLCEDRDRGHPCTKEGMILSLKRPLSSLCCGVRDQMQGLQHAGPSLHH